MLRGCCVCLQCPSVHTPSSISCHVSEDTHHTSEGLVSDHAMPQVAPTDFSPQFPGLPFLMQSGPRAPPPGSVPWPMGLGITDPPPCVQHPDNTSAPPWAGAAMMQYLLGPLNPVQAQLMLQIQLLADKSGENVHRFEGLCVMSPGTEVGRPTDVLLYCHVAVCVLCAL